MSTTRLSICLFSFFALSGSAFLMAASNPPGLNTGLELSKDASIPVIVEDLGPDLEAIGLTRDEIEARVNSVLRRNGITPANASMKPPHYHYLYVNVYLARNFLSLQLEFHRLVHYGSGGETFSISAPSWRRQRFAVFTNRNELILDGIAGLAEVFCNEFLKANPQ